MAKINRRLRLLNIRLDDIAVDTLLARLVGCVRTRERLLVVNANANLINLAQRDHRLIALFDRAGIAFCDGAGVQLAVWLQTGQRPARHTPPQWIIPLGSQLAQYDASVYWLGGEADTVAKAAEVFTAKTGMRCAGAHHGFFDIQPGSAENEDVIDRINHARPDLLLVNLGMPRQELWLDENWHKLDATVGLTGGALVDHLAGRVNRPPIWVADLGLEWLVRLAIEPRRLWRRYLFGLPVFAVRVLSSLFFNGRTRYVVDVDEQSHPEPR